MVIEELGPSEVDKVGAIIFLLETSGSTIDEIIVIEEDNRNETLDCFAIGLILITA